jgi:hypothetical protein
MFVIVYTPIDPKFPNKYLEFDSGRFCTTSRIVDALKFATRYHALAFLPKCLTLPEFHSASVLNVEHVDNAAAFDQWTSPQLPLFDPTTEEQVARRTLVNMLDRLGGDGACMWLNNTPSSAISDEIFSMVRWLEERAAVAELVRCLQSFGINDVDRSMSIEVLRQRLPKKEE